MRPLTAEIGWRVWGTPANFNGFRILASLLQRRQSPEANQTLHDVCPSPGLVDKIYTFGGSCPLTEFCKCKIDFASKYYVILYWQRYCIAQQHSSRGCQSNFAAWYKEWNYRTFAEGAAYIRLRGHHVLVLVLA